MSPMPPQWTCGCSLLTLFDKPSILGRNTVTRFRTEIGVACVSQSLKEDLVAKKTKKTTKKKTTTSISSKKRKTVSKSQSKKKVTKKTKKTTKIDSVKHTKKTVTRKKKKLTKKPTLTVKTETDQNPPQKIRTPLKAKQLRYYQELLLLRRTDLVGDVQALESGALRASGSGNLSHVPQHMADAGSDTYEQDFNLSLAAAEREMLKQIDAALLRLDDKTFGICLESGELISKERLEAKPWARYTIEIAREKERKGGR